MTARVLDGTAIASQIRAELAPEMAAFTARAGRPPGLAIVLVGNDPASELYVRGKLRSAGEAGLRADLERLPVTSSIEDVLAVVDRLNHSDVHDGILVQSPLPPSMPNGACSTSSIPGRTWTDSIPSTSANSCRTGLCWRPARRRGSSSCSSD